jgi:hypothetical protein
MKKYTTFLLAGLACVAFVSLMALTSKTQSTFAKEPYILIEIYEVPSYPDKGVHIHYGGNKREFIPFPGMSVEHHDEAGDITLAAINKLVAEGYEIESTASGLAQSGMITKIFMRKK